MSAVTLLENPSNITIARKNHLLILIKIQEYDRYVKLVGTTPLLLLSLNISELTLIKQDLL